MYRFKVRLAAVVIIGLALLEGCSTFRAPDDGAITSDIQAKLFADPVLKTRDIRVSSSRGAVTLSGSVATELEKAAAEHFASRVDGVRNVVNMLTVGSQPAAQALSSAAPADAANAQVTEPEPEPAAKPKRTRHHKPARTTDEKASVQPAAFANGSSTNASAAPQDSPAPPVPAQPVAAPAPAPQPPPAPKPAEHLTVPSGTIVTIRTIDPIDSRSNRPGEEFSASVEAPIVVGDRVVVPRGSDARVRLVNAKSAGSMTGRSELQVELISVTINGKPYPTESGYYELHGASRGTRTAETVGGGAVLGALIGGILGHGKGAAIGSAVGAGAGAGTQAATKGQQVNIPAETKLDFTLKSPVDVVMSGGS